MDRTECEEAGGRWSERTKSCRLTQRLGTGFVIGMLVLFFLVALGLLTLVGALFLYVAVEVFHVGVFSWWYAFLIGLMLAILATMFAGRR